MNCTQSQNMLDGYIDDLLSVIQLNDVQAHLNDCNKCRGVFTQAQDLANTLKDMPIPPAKIGYEQRMLKFLEKKKSQNKRHTSWFIAGFGSAITASFALWLVFSPFSAVPIQHKNLSVVNLLVDEKQTIDLVFNLANELPDAVLTIELPDKVKIAGYPDKRQLTWKTSFKKGANRLALPLISSGNHKGILIARLSKNGITKVFRVRINIKLPSTSLLIPNNITTNT